MTMKLITYCSFLALIQLNTGCNQAQPELSFEEKYLKSGPGPALEEIKSIPASNDEEALQKIEILSNRIATSFPNSAEAVEARNIAESAAQRLKTIKQKENEEQLAKIKELKKTIKSSFNAEQDEMSDITFYIHKTFSNPLKNQISPYFSVTKSKESLLRFHFKYFGDDWLFVKSMTVKCDEEKSEFGFPLIGQGAIKRDHSHGKVWEWGDFVASPDQIAFLECAADSSKVVKYRLNGTDYYKDFTMSKEHQKAIKQTLEVFQAQSATKIL